VRQPGVVKGFPLRLINRSYETVASQSVSFVAHDALHVVDGVSTVINCKA
jgi:hypothetical protein